MKKGKKKNTPPQKTHNPKNNLDSFVREASPEAGYHG